MHSHSPVYMFATIVTEFNCDCWIQVMVHIARKLEALHAAGWVHRDLKPGNAIWLPSNNSWTLIDFGCAAHVGVQLAPMLAFLCRSVSESISEVCRA
jgi:serine/threonine protein kinase